MTPHLVWFKGAASYLARSPAHVLRAVRGLFSPESMGFAVMDLMLVLRSLSVPHVFRATVRINA